MKRMLLTMKGHLRPYLSAAIPMHSVRLCYIKLIAEGLPNITLPTDRNIRTKVMPQVIWELDFPNCLANCETVSETVKKSNASQDHPKKPTRKNIHCWKLSKARSLNGLGALFMGGLSVGIRVAIYLPTLIL